MNRPILGLLVALALSVSLSASMMAIVQADRVTFGAEFVPRRLDLPAVLTVPAGTTFELKADSTYDTIEVFGTLTVSRTQDTRLRVTHLIVMPGGVLDLGTEADPIPCYRYVEIIFRDVPIDPSKDPFQWGNGLVNFGRRTAYGCAKTAWVEATDSLFAGVTGASSTTVPEGWQAGDALLIPDTVTANPAVSRSRRESPISLTSVGGGGMTFSNPLAFAHPSIVDTQGTLVLRPRIANLTRNIVIRSEHPAGTRGHTVDIGHDATWDLRYARFEGLGRTTNAPLDDTAGSHLGTNQRGKYAVHHHHVGSCPTCVDEGNVYVGPGYVIGSKWGLALHGTSDTRVEQNIAVDWPGAGIVTEDGNEARHVFRQNFMAYSESPRPARTPFAEINANCPGCEGTGGWFRGVLNTFDGNEAWNNRTGLLLMNQQQPTGILYPSVPGGPDNTLLKPATDVPVAVIDTVVAANIFHGFEVWGVSRAPNDRLIAANNTYDGVLLATSSVIDGYFRDPILVCDAATSEGQIGLHSSGSYVRSLEVVGGRIMGCDLGLSEGGGMLSTVFTGTVLQNKTNLGRLDLARSFTLENVTHLPLGAFPHRYIEFIAEPIWTGTGPFPQSGQGSKWTFQRGSPYIVKNWQGTGKDYRLTLPHALGNNLAWPSYAAPPGAAGYSFSPDAGITMEQLWNLRGMGYSGDMIRNAEALTLDGLVNGIARLGLDVPFGPARAVITWPTLRDAIPSGLTSLIGYGLVTGDPVATEAFWYQIDGGPSRLLLPDPSSPSDRRRLAITNLADGAHTITTWRNYQGSPNAYNTATFRYCVGAGCGTLPPPPTCPSGQHLENGQCVPDLPPEPTWQVGTAPYDVFRVGTTGPLLKVRVCTAGACQVFLPEP